MYGPVSVEALQTRGFEVCSLGKVVMVLQYFTYLQLSCLVVWCRITMYIVKVFRIHYASAFSVCDRSRSTCMSTACLCMSSIAGYH